MHCYRETFQSKYNSLIWHFYFYKLCLGTTNFSETNSRDNSINLQYYAKGTRQCILLLSPKSLAVCVLHFWHKLCILCDSQTLMIPAHSPNCCSNSNACRGSVNATEIMQFERSAICKHLQFNFSHFIPAVRSVHQ